MARETVAQRRLRMEAEQAERETKEWKEFVDSYPARFASVLFEFMNLNHANFVVMKSSDTEYRFEKSWVMEVLSVVPPTDYDYNFMESLVRLEDEVKSYFEEKVEQNRKYEAKQALLNRLTKEEKELLDL